MNITRRRALSVLAGMAGLSAVHGSLGRTFAMEAIDRHIATNTYPWGTFASRDGQPFAQHTDQLFADIASTGLQGYEPIINAPTECDGLEERLKRHGLEMRSLYVNSELHEEATAEQSMGDVVAIAKAARGIGTKIIVTNPSPIQWGGTQDKSETELKIQATALDCLGAELRGLGLALAYHNHDAELRREGREFHQMLTDTDPDNVKFCLDAHWVYRGSGNSTAAVFDALNRYGDRVVELHLRQSHDGVWDEVFTMDGDIDYRRVCEFLDQKGNTPHLVLEQSVEAKSQHRLNAIESHRQSRTNLERFLVANGI